MTRILLTNDDGIHSPGIAALRHAIEGLGDIVAMAPDRNTSAVARGITVGRPVRLKAAHFGPGFDGLAVTGTPVDCVRVALLGVLGAPPELVVSGVNLGANMGNDVTYSGTVGAALEAALHRVPGVAFSVEEREPRFLESAAPLMRRIVAQLISSPLPVGTTLNVNLPDRPAAEIAGLRVTSLGGSSTHDRVIVQSEDGATGEHKLTFQRAPVEPWAITDFQAVAEGYVSLTPIHYELTSRPGLAELVDWPFDALAESGALAEADALAEAGAQGSALPDAVAEARAGTRSQTGLAPNGAEEQRDPGPQRP